MTNYTLDSIKNNTDLTHDNTKNKFVAAANVFLVFLTVMAFCCISVKGCEYFSPNDNINVIYIPKRYSSIVNYGKLSTYRDLINNNNETPKNCSICLEEYLLDDKIIRIKCNHIFHTNCLEQWNIISTKPSNIVRCPLCNNGII